MLAEDINTEKRDDVRQMRIQMEHMQQDRKFLYIHARDEKQRARELEKKLDRTNSELEEFKERLQEQKDRNREINLRILKEVTLGSGEESVTDEGFEQRIRDKYMSLDSPYENVVNSKLKQKYSSNYSN